MRRFALALAALLASTAAQAQQTLAPEEVAALAADICLGVSGPPAFDETIGAFTRTGQTERTADYVHPAGPTLALARREGFFSCEIVVRDAGEAWFSDLNGAFAARIAEDYETDDFEQVEDGLAWEIFAGDGREITAELQRDEGGRVTLTAATQNAQTSPEARDDN